MKARKLSSTISIMGVVASLTGAAQAQQNGSMWGLDYVLAPETTHLLLPARSISSEPGLVTSVRWASQQPALVVMTQPSPFVASDFMASLMKQTKLPVQTISLWTPGEKVIRPVMTGTSLYLSSFNVVPETRIGLLNLFVGDGQEIQMFSLNGGQGKRTKLPEEVSGEVIVSKSRPWAMMIGSTYKGKIATVSINLLNLQTGEWMESYNTREQPFSYSGSLYLEKDDQVAIALRGVNGQQGQTAIFDPLNGKVAKILPFESFSELFKEAKKSAPVPLYRAVSTQERNAQGRGPTDVLRVTIKPDLVAGGGAPSSFFLPGVTMGEVSGDDRYLAVVSSNMIGIREFAQTKTDAFKTLLAQHEAQTLLNAAKQVGIAFIMYSADNDDRFPGSESWQFELQAYLKNKDLMNGFDFKLGGKTLSGIEDPSKTVLGTIQGQFGTATVYADGSAKWTVNR
jgi:hypothetical protein